MQSYHRSLTSVPVPLLVVQGISSDLRPIVKEQRSRIIKEQEYENEETKLNYGVQIQIDRELDDLKNECVTRLINLIDSCNARDQLWWSSQDANNNQQQPHPSSNDLKRQRQRISKQLSTSGSQGSHNSKGLWFNVKYCDSKYEIIINGSNSSLSPYNEKGDFYGSLLPLQWVDKYYDYIPSAFLTFYEIGNDETFDALLINEINRIKLKFSNTMIKFVVVLINLYPKTTNLRISNILSKINIGSNSIFVINGNNDEVSKREQISFIKKLLIGLRSYSNDFFDLQIQKLKKREIKNVLYTEKFFNVRNLIKLAVFEQFKAINEYSTKFLEYSYDKLLQLLKTIDKNPTNVIYLEVRGWLDIICLHIVRSCIALGDNNISYRKFSFHLQKIKELDPANYSNDWISLQHTWFGELIENINLNEIEILPADLTILPTVGLKEIKFNSYNMPQNGFIFLQAYNYRCNDLVDDNRILLLNAALDSFNMSKLTRFQRFESKIYLLLGDVYYEMKNYSMAINNYFAGISIFKQENCKFIQVFILKKILVCYIKLNKLNESKSVYIELCCMGKSDSKQFLDEMKEKIISLDLINDDSVSALIKDEGDEKQEGNSLFIKNNVFNIDIGVKKYSNMMNDGVDIQLIITPKGSTMIDNLEISKFELDIAGSSEVKKITILNEPLELEGHIVRQLTSTCDEPGEILKTSLVFRSEQVTNKSIILQLHIKSKKVGKFYIPKIKTTAILNDFKFTSITNIGGLDVANNYFKWYGDNEIIKATYPKNSFEIIPKIPDIKLSLHYENIGFNGRKIPIEIKFLNADEDMNVKLKLAGYGKLENVNGIKIEWEDNPDEILKPGNERIVKCHAILPQVNGLSLTSKDVEDNCIITFNIIYVLINDGAVEVSVTKQAKMKVIEMIEWNTRLNPDVNNVKFPNLFKINDGIDINGHNLPIHLRKWNFKLSLKNNSFDDIVITNKKFSINAPTGVTLNIQSNDEKDILFKSMANIKFNMILDVSADKIIRTVPVDIKCELEYHIGNNIIQTYILDMYKASLPHIDPRIVIVIDNFEDKQIVIRYVFENPTNRIFQYQTNLNTIQGIEILNYVKTMKINLMPFMQESITFKYRIVDDDSDIIELPEFTVYDKQYKIFVKSSCGDDRFRLIDGHLFLYK